MNSSSLFWNDGIVINENKIYFLSVNFHCVLELVIETKKIRLLFSINEDKLYRSIVLYNDCIFAFPAARGDVYVYNLNSSELIKKSIPDTVHELDEMNWSANYIQSGDSVYFCWRDPVITRYCLQTDEWDTYREWRNNELFVNDKRHWFKQNAFETDDQIYYLLGKSNKLLVMNKIDGSHRFIDLFFDKKNDYLEQMYFFNNVIWMLVVDGDHVPSVYVCDLSNLADCKKVCELCYEPVSGNAHLFEIVGCTDWALFYSRYSRNIYKVSRESNEVELIYNSQCNVQSENELGSVYNVFTPGSFDLQRENYYIINPSTTSLISINLHTGNIINDHIIISDDERRKIYTSFLSDSVVKEEKTMMSLNDFILYI